MLKILNKQLEKQVKLSIFNKNETKTRKSTLETELKTKTQNEIKLITKQKIQKQKIKNCDNSDRFIASKMFWFGGFYHI